MNTHLPPLVTDDPHSLVFRFESLIIAVECKDIDAAQFLVSLAILSGFRESGITSVNKRVIIAIRCSIRLEVPLGDSEKIMVSPEYVEYLVELANAKILLIFYMIHQALVCHSFNRLFYPLVERITGPVMISRIGTVLSIPLLGRYPYIALLTGFGLSIALNCASMLKNILSVSITTGLLIMQNRDVPQEQRGAANGMSTSSMFLFKTIGPAARGSLIIMMDLMKRHRRWILTSIPIKV